ncbi:hypothetical protein [uncultured Polaribacter sp.]|uniref:hypothetical protein n=1 Tax=uncultured Polaribacter sp. TaxID=174711 RepID=UPI00259B0424|nr:hypothetical protein [uncultured Polaribacter sp.]
MNLIYITLGLLILLIIVNITAIYLTKKGLTKDENNNMIPDILEEKFSQLKEEVSFKVDRVGEEMKDVTKAIKEVGNALYNNAVYENNIQAQIFFLKNRGEDGQWSDKNENVYTLNLSNVLTEAQGRIIEGERVKEVTDVELVSMKELHDLKETNK